MCPEFRKSVWYWPPGILRVHAMIDCRKVAQRPYKAAREIRNHQEVKDQSPQLHRPPRCKGIHQLDRRTGRLFHMVQNQR